MKLLIIFILMVFFATVQKKYSNVFEFKGVITGLNNGIIYLYYDDTNHQSVKDSASVTNGNFYFKGRINGPTIAYLYLKNGQKNQNNSATIFLEPTLLKGYFNLNKFDEAKIEGSLTQKKFDTLNFKKTHIRLKYKKLIDSISVVKSDSERYLMRDKLSPFFDEIKKVDLQFIDRNPQSYITCYLLTIDGRDLTLDSLKMYYKKLGKRILRCANATMILNNIENRESGSIGSMAFKFSGKDNAEHNLLLSDYKGKFVLVDFWASWCIPCRRGNPHLRYLFKT